MRITAFQPQFALPLACTISSFADEDYMFADLELLVVDNTPYVRLTLGVGTGVHLLLLRCRSRTFGVVALMIEALDSASACVSGTTTYTKPYEGAYLGAIREASK
jgi:hypothetical protein